VNAQYLFVKHEVIVGKKLIDVYLITNIKRFNSKKKKKKRESNIAERTNEAN